MCQICQKWAGKAPAEGRPNLASPSPNVRRDKISRSGEPLTLISARYWLEIAQNYVPRFFFVFSKSEKIC